MKNRDFGVQGIPVGPSLLSRDTGAVRVHSKQGSILHAFLPGVGSKQGPALSTLLSDHRVVVLLSDRRVVELDRDGPRAAVE